MENYFVKKISNDHFEVRSKQSVLTDEAKIETYTGPDAEQKATTVTKLLNNQVRDAFRKACLEILGEDPNDWGSPESEAEKAELFAEMEKLR